MFYLNNVILNLSKYVYKQIINYKNDNYNTISQILRN